MTQKQGLQLFNANGEMLLDVTNTLTRFLGYFDTGRANPGSFTDAKITNGNAWMTYYNIEGYDYRDAVFMAWSEGSQIKWQYVRGESGTRIKNYRVYYGVY